MSTFKLLFFLLALKLCSCRNLNKSDTSDGVESFKEPKIIPIYFNEVCQGDSCSYVHFLMLTSFDEANFNNYDFVYIADKYLDSVKTNLPVAAIEFCKPFKFVNIGGSENHEQLEKHAITSLWYALSSKDDRVPEISHISIWTNGQRKDLDYLHIKSRRQRMEYYNSKK
jgi:hypothetical protein